MLEDQDPGQVPSLPVQSPVHTAISAVSAGESVAPLDDWSVLCALRGGGPGRDWLTTIQDSLRVYGADLSDQWIGRLSVRKSV